MDDIKALNPCYEPTIHAPSDWSGDAYDLAMVESVTFRDFIFVTTGIGDMLPEQPIKQFIISELDSCLDVIKTNMTMAHLIVVQTSLSEIHQGQTPDKNTLESIASQLAAGELTPESCAELCLIKTILGLVDGAKPSHLLQSFLDLKQSVLVLTAKDTKEFSVKDDKIWEKLITVLADCRIKGL